MFEESSEFFQYMSTIDEEKLGFKKLIDIKDRLFVELKDYKEDKQIQVLDKKDVGDCLKLRGWLVCYSHHIIFVPELFNTLFHF